MSTYLGTEEEREGANVVDRDAPRDGERARCGAQQDVHVALQRALRVEIGRRLGAGLTRSAQRAGLRRARTALDLELGPAAVLERAQAR